MNEDRRFTVRRASDAHVAALPPPPALPRISWGAILAGMVVAVSLQMLLSALGLGIGLSTVQPASEGGNPAEGLGVGAAIWWVVSGVLALFLGGWTAGRLANVTRKLDRGLHGLVTWGVATVFSAWMLTSALGGVVGGAWGAVNDQLAARGDQATSRIQAQIDRLLQQSDDPAAQQQARETADRTADAASGTAFGLFVMLLLGAAAATFGGMTARPRGVDEEERAIRASDVPPRSAVG